MEAVINSIIADWKNENPSLAKKEIGSLQLKYRDDQCGIYTIYFNAGQEFIRLKAIKNPQSKFSEIVRYLKTVFGITIKDTWKIIELK
jgi:hypothetical protein